MVELGGHNSPVSLLDVANEKKIFFLVTLQAGLTKGGDDRSSCGAVDTGITSYSPHIGF